MVYEYIFTSQRFRLGFYHGCYWQLAWRGYSRIKPPPNSLSILRVNSPIATQIGNQWLGWTLFHFESIKDMLLKLGPLSPETRAQMKRIHVHATLMQLTVDGRSMEMDLFDVISLLPGLKLESLTVLDCSNGMDPSYARSRFFYTLRLLRQGQGWRELLFISFNGFTLELGFRSPHGNRFQFYRDQVAAREEGAKLDMWRAKEAYRGDILDPADRVKYEPDPYFIYGRHRKSPNFEKFTMIHFKRSPSATDIEAPLAPPDPQADPWKELRSMPFDELERVHIHGVKLDAKSRFLAAHGEEVVEERREPFTDVYSDPEELKEFPSTFNYRRMSVHDIEGNERQEVLDRLAARLDKAQKEA
ncbi:hypothetical protein F5Y15DRAFT_416841 [Xylariaceae sp. FL0016]|nr:hypothetical protein F5Y15DRAFT_416841 [Xylariaceae sp. FL0016]